MPVHHSSSLLPNKSSTNLFNFIDAYKLVALTDMICLLAKRRFIIFIYFYALLRLIPTIIYSALYPIMKPQETLQVNKLLGKYSMIQWAKSTWCLHMPWHVCTQSQEEQHRKFTWCVLLFQMRDSCHARQVIHPITENNGKQWKTMETLCVHCVWELFTAKNITLLSQEQWFVVTDFILRCIAVA